MNTNQQFPKISVKENIQGYEATVAVELKSLLKSDLLAGHFASSDDESRSLDQRILQANREAFLQNTSNQAIRCFQKWRSVRHRL